MKSKNYIAAFRIFYFISFIIFAIFFIMERKSIIFAEDRAIKTTIAYVPIAIIGLVSLLKPQISIEAFTSKKTGFKFQEKLAFRILGIFLIVMSIFSIITAWSYVI